MQKFTLKPLLFAGVFLSWSVIANNCLSLTGQEVSVLTFSFPCPVTTTVEVAGSSCVVTRKARVGQAEFICTEAAGEWLGGPWEYTGEQAGTNPDNPDQPVPPDTYVKVPEDVSVPDYQNASGSLKTFSEKMDKAIKVLAQNQYGQVQQSEINNKKVLDRITQANNSLYVQNQGLQSDLYFTRQDLQNRVSSVSVGVSNLDTINRQLHKKTHDTQAEHSAVLDQLSQNLNSTAGLVQYNKNMIDNIWNAIGTSGPGSGCGGFDCPPSYSLAQILQINQQQLLEALDSGGSGGGSSNDDVVNVLSAIESRVGTTNSRLKDTNKLLESIDSKTTEGSGGSTDLTETNQRLNDINNTLANNAQGLSMQLGQQLYAIQSAIENGSGGGGSDDDTETNAKLDGIAGQLDKTNQGIDKLVDSLTPGEQQADPLTQSDINKETSKIVTPDYQKASDDGFKQVNDAMSAHDNDVKKVEGLVDTFKGVASVSEFFRNAPAQCGPLVLGGRELNLCNRTDDIRTVLTYIFYMLTIIFLIRSAHQTIENLRLS